MDDYQIGAAARAGSVWARMKIARRANTHQRVQNQIRLGQVNGILFGTSPKRSGVGQQPTYHYFVLYYNGRTYELAKPKQISATQVNGYLKQLIAIQRRKLK